MNKIFIFLLLFPLSVYSSDAKYGIWFDDYKKDGRNLVIVSKIDEYSRAEQAGVENGFILIRINDTDVENLDNVRKYLVPNVTNSFTFYDYKKNEPPFRIKITPRVDIPPSETSVSIGERSPDLTVIEKKAKNGDARMQYNAGSYYAMGHSFVNGKFTKIGKNYNLAVYWMEQAAIQGYPYALEKMGDWHAEGVVVEQNPNKAKYWYTKWLAKKESVTDSDRYHAQDMISSAMEGKKYKDPYPDDWLEEKWYRKFSKFVSENKEEIAAAAVAIAAGAIINDQLSADNECFRPNNDDCNGWQKKHHKSLYKSVAKHFKGYASCTPQNVADFVNRSIGTVTGASLSALTIDLTGDNEILVDFYELEAALGC